MSEQIPERDSSYLNDLEPQGDYAPKVSPRVRDIAYYIGLAIAAVGFMVTNSAAAVMEDPTVVVVIAGNVVSGFGMIAAGLGVAYRPGKSGA